MLLPFLLLPMMIANPICSRFRMIGRIVLPSIYPSRLRQSILQPRWPPTQALLKENRRFRSFLQKPFAVEIKSFSSTSDEPGSDHIPPIKPSVPDSDTDTPPLNAISDDDDEKVEERTYQWLRRVVIGLNLCPFAREPTLAKQLRIVVCRGNDEDLILETVCAEVEALVESARISTSASDPVHSATAITHTTTLVVCPECYPNDFHEYLNIAQDLEDAIAEIPEYNGVVQVASFHPLYCFDGSPDPTEPDNSTNQSPYPIFHILREMDVTQAVEQLPEQNAAVVWSRNVDLLRALHKALPATEFAATIAGTQRTSAQVRDMVRSFPIPLIRGPTDNTKDE